MDHQVVAPVGVNGGPGGQWDALFEDGSPQVEVLDELLDVDTELTQLGGQGRTSHGHLSWDGGPQAPNVMGDLRPSCFLQSRRLGGHLGPQISDLTDKE